ncbi:MAG: hypothetical protein ACHQX3_04030 [Nitrospirales bacterium]
MLAGHLGWPQATFLASLHLTAEGSAAIVTREVDAGIEQRRVRLPAVATVDLRIIGKRAVRNAALASEDRLSRHTPATMARYTILLRYFIGERSM